MSGTDKTKTPTDLAGPLVILVEPQLGENIGMAARAISTTRCSTSPGSSHGEKADAVTTAPAAGKW